MTRGIRDETLRTVEYVTVALIAQCCLTIMVQYLPIFAAINSSGRNIKAYNTLCLMNFWQTLFNFHLNFLVASRWMLPTLSRAETFIPQIAWGNNFISTLEWEAVLQTLYSWTSSCEAISSPLGKMKSLELSRLLHHSGKIPETSRLKRMMTFLWKSESE